MSRRRNRPQRVRLAENTAEKIARIIGEKYDIKVIFKADLCATNGNKIFLPVIPNDAPDEVLKALPGIVDHETAHVLFTDFEGFQSIAEHEDPNKLHALANVFEDARIEEAMRNRYRGTKNNMTRCHDWAYDKMLGGWDKINPWGKFAQAIGVLACHEDAYWAAKEIATREPELWEYANQFKDLARSAATLSSTTEVLELAKKLYEMVKPPKEEPEEEEKKQEPQQEPQQGGQQSEEGEEGEQNKDNKEDSEDEQDENSGSGDQENEDEQDEEDSEEGSGNEDGKDEQDDGEDSEEDSEDNRQDGDQSVPVRPAPEELLEDYSDEDAKEDNQRTSHQEQLRQEAARAIQDTNDSYMVYTTEFDEFEKIEGGDRQRLMQLVGESKAITNVVRTKMMRNLLTLTKARVEPNKSRGQINSRALYRLVNGSGQKNVFKKRVVAPGMETRVSLWVDHSESMRGRKLTLASEAAIIFGEVLSQLKVPFEICGFSTSTTHREGSARYYQASPEDRRVYTRWGSLWVGQYKGFEENWHTVRPRLVGMERNHHDNTFDAESIRIAAQRLLAYPEQRRILFWLNDGFPCPNTHAFMDQHHQYHRAMVKEVEKHIEVFAVGIQDDNVQRFFKNFVVIHKLEDLPTVMVAELDRLLRKGQSAYKSRVA